MAGKHLFAGAITGTTLENQTPESCAAACIAHPQCRGFDIGTGNSIQGTCYLRSANGQTNPADLRDVSYSDHYAVQDTQSKYSVFVLCALEFELDRTRKLKMIQLYIIV